MAEVLREFGTIFFFRSPVHLHLLPPILHLHVSVIRRPGDVERAADIVDVQRVIFVQFSGSSHLGFVVINGRTSAESPTGAGGGEPCLGPLLNQPTLKLGERGEYVEDQLARRAGGVDETVADGPEADTSIAEFFDQLDQVVH